MVQCDFHKAQKKGFCRFCGGCKLCDPNPGCPTRTSHSKPIVGPKRARMDVAPTTNLIVSTPAPIGYSLVEGRFSKIKAKTSLGLLDYSDQPKNIDAEASHSDPQTKVVSLFQVLGLSHYLFDCIPLEGFNPDALGSQSSQSRFKRTIESFYLSNGI